MSSDLIKCLKQKSNKYCKWSKIKENKTIVSVPQHLKFLFLQEIHTPPPYFALWRGPNFVWNYKQKRICRVATLWKLIVINPNTIHWSHLNITEWLKNTDISQSQTGLPIHKITLLALFSNCIGAVENRVLGEGRYNGSWTNSTKVSDCWWGWVSYTLTKLLNKISLGMRCRRIIADFRALSSLRKGKFVRF